MAAPGQRAPAAAPDEQLDHCLSLARSGPEKSQQWTPARERLKADIRLGFSTGRKAPEVVVGMRRVAGRLAVLFRHR